MPDSLWPNGLWPTRFLCPWDFLGKDTGVVFHFLLQGIFPTQGSNLGLLYCRQILYRLSYQGLILACYSFNLKNFLIESLKYVHRQSYVTPWQQWLLWLTTKSSRIKHSRQSHKGNLHALSRVSECRTNSMLSEVAQSRPTLCDPMDDSLPGSVVHGILQARILEWAVIPFSRGSSQPREQSRVSCIADRCFTVWATVLHTY